MSNQDRYRIRNEMGSRSGATTASGVTFDPTGTTMAATDVQSAIVEVAEFVPTFLMRFWRPNYTVTPGNVNTTANTITLTDHRLADGTQVSWPTGWDVFTDNTPYFVIRVDANTIKLASTRANAYRGTAMDITAAPGGSRTLASSNGHHVWAGKMHRTKTEMTFSIADADVDPTNNTITIRNHGFETGHGIQFDSSWGSLTSGTLYYVIRIDDSTIKVASSYLNAMAESAFDITADPGGTVTCYGVYGNCYYDALVTPQAEAEYVFSVGYGGAHAMLLGFNGGSGGRIAITGNISTAAGAVDIGFTSGTDEAFIGKPVHIAAMIYANTLVIFMNGVPSKRFTKSTGRGVNDFGDGTGMFIGGSDHSNFEGDIYWVRVFENHVPRYYTPDNGECLRVSPRPRTTYYESVSGKFITANLLLSFSSPATTIPNLGKPLVPGRSNHGIRAAGTDADIFGDFNSFEEYELPQQIRAELPSRPDYALTPTTPPVGAKIFDSFKRNDVTYLWRNYLGLGQTEGGSLGVKAWQQTNASAPRHGILFGRAFVEGLGADTTREYVDNDSPYMKVEIENNGAETVGAVLFAAYDFTADTGIKASHNGGDTITLYKVTTGTPVSLGNFVIPGDNVPYTLGIEYTSTKQIKLLIDGVVQVTHDDSANPALTGVSAGFTSSVGYCRFEDFAVYAASA